MVCSQKEVRDVWCIYIQPFKCVLLITISKKNNAYLNTKQTEQMKNIMRGQVRIACPQPVCTLTTHSASDISLETQNNFF